MRHSLGVVELALALIGFVLLSWSHRGRVAMPDVRPVLSLRWWFPWPQAREFTTHRAYRIEQLGRIALWTFSLVAVVEFVIAAVRPQAG